MKPLMTCILLATLAATGCTGVPLKTTTPMDPQGYEVVGRGSATATGIMLFNIIPIQQNNRQLRAYNAAVQRAGGDALINMEIQENWFWAWVLNGYKTTVSGDVIKYR